MAQAQVQTQPTAKLARSRSPKVASTEKAPAGARCLLLEGAGQPDCPEFFAGLEALEGVTQLLKSALVRAGRPGEEIGEVERSWNFRNEDHHWLWKLKAAVPHSVTASVLELAKHLCGRGAAEPIILHVLEK